MEPNGNMGHDQWKGLYRRSDHVVSREIVGETILVPIRGNLADMRRIFSLNAVGAYIWGKLDGKNGLDAIRNGILTDFNVDEEKAAADLHEFISNLLEAELIVGLG